MDSYSNITALLLISMLFVSSAAPVLDCGSCTPAAPTPKQKKKPSTPGVLPPINVKPPVKLPPITLPPVIKPPAVLPVPPVTVPPVTLPPIKPPVPLPPIPKLPIPLPPVGTLPPITKPPISLPPIGTLPPISKQPISLPPIGTLPPISKPPIPLPPIGNLPPINLPPVTLPPITKPPKGKRKACPPQPGKATCPIDTLKLGACVDLLGGLVHIGVGDSVVSKCCPLLSGLVEVEAAACLCTTLKIKALNLKLYVPIALQLLIICGKTPPPGYTCSL